MLHVCQKIINLILFLSFLLRFNAYCLISASKNYSTKGLRCHPCPTNSIYYFLLLLKITGYQWYLFFKLIEHTFLNGRLINSLNETRHSYFYVTPKIRSFTSLHHFPQITQQTLAKDIIHLLITEILSFLQILNVRKTRQITYVATYIHCFFLTVVLLIC